MPFAIFALGKLNVRALGSGVRYRRDCGIAGRISIDGCVAGAIGRGRPRLRHRNWRHNLRCLRVRQRLVDRRPSSIGVSIGGGPTSGVGSTTATATAPAPAPAPAPVGHGPTPQIHASPPPASACGGGLMLEPPPADVSAVKAVATLSEATQAYIRECGCATQQCIADALDQYAKALAVVAPRLPKPLRNLPGSSPRRRIASASPGPRRKR